jgi:hypothetical protein
MSITRKEDREPTCLELLDVFQLGDNINSKKFKLYARVEKVLGLTGRPVPGWVRSDAQVVWLRAMAAVLRLLNGEER